MLLPDLQYLMHQIGPETPDISAILQEESDRWQIIFEDDVSIQVSWQADAPRVVLSCVVSEVPDHAREWVYAHLLVANALPVEGMSLRFALDFPDQRVMMIGELDKADLSLEAFRNEILSFLDCAMNLLSFIAESVSATGEEPVVPPGDGALQQLA